MPLIGCCDKTEAQPVLARFRLVATEELDQIAIPVSREQ
jgi:hypothetical protein